MNNPSQRVLNLLRQSSTGNFQQLEKIINKYQFTQKEIDDAFRECISNYNSNNKQNETYKKSINLFLKKVEDINYQNPDFNNTTILMYAIDKSKEAPVDLIIECFKEEININIKDNNLENTIFHLVKNNNFSEKVQCEFFKNLLDENLNFNEKNSLNETIINIIKKNNRKDLLNEIENKKNIGKLNQIKLSNIYNNDNLNEILDFLKNISNSNVILTNNIYLNEINYVNKNSLEYNKLLIEMRLLLSSNDKIYIPPLNNYIENNAINEFQLKIIKILKNVTINDNSYSICLFINKLIMYYQIDNIKEVIKLRESFKPYSFLNDNILLTFYKTIIYIDMLIQRNKINEAKYEINSITNLISEENSVNLKNFVFPSKDMLFEINDINYIIFLYKIFIESLSTDKYENLLNQLNNYNLNTKSVFVIDFYKNIIIRLTYLIKKDKADLYINNYISNENKILKNNGHLFINKSNIYLEIEKIYLYQYQGIICLKKGKYNISSYCFLKCLTLINKKNQLQLIKRNHIYPTIIFNLALSYFYNKNYVKCIKLLYFLLNYSNNKEKFFMQNKFIYYRLGLAQLELLLKNNNKINMLYNSYKNNKFILKYQNNANKIKISNDIIENLKKAFLLIKKDPKSRLYFNCLCNIVFCLIINQNYTEAIFYLKNSKIEEKHEKNIINNYLLQCYLYLNNINEALKVSKKIIFDDYNSNKTNKYFEKLNNCLINIKGFNLSFLINLIKMNIMTNNKKELEKQLFLLLNCSGINIEVKDDGKTEISEELPSFIINVFIYYYCFINRKDLAIDIIKTRRIKEMIPK